MRWSKSSDVLAFKVDVEYKVLIVVVPVTCYFMVLVILERYLVGIDVSDGNTCIADMGELTGFRIDDIMFVVEVADLELDNVFALFIERDIKSGIVLCRVVVLSLVAFIESFKLCGLVLIFGLDLPEVKEGIGVVTEVRLDTERILSEIGGDLQIEGFCSAVS